MQWLCMAMKKIFLTFLTPTPKTGQPFIHSLDLDADTRAVSLLSNLRWISKWRYGRCHSITFPLSNSGWRCGKSVYCAAFSDSLPSSPPPLQTKHTGLKISEDITHFNSLLLLDICYCSLRILNSPQSLRQTIYLYMLFSKTCSYPGFSCLDRCWL